MLGSKNPASAGSEIMKTFTSFFDKADKRFDQIKKTVEKDREELRKSGNLEQMGATLLLSVKKGFKTDLLENNVAASAQKPYMDLLDEAWGKQQMARQAEVILSSPELKGIDKFIGHLENLPKLRKCIESADPKANWEILLANIASGDSQVSEYFGPVLSMLGLDHLVNKKEEADNKKKTEATKKDAKQKEESDKAKEEKQAEELDEEVIPKKPDSTCFVGDSHTATMMGKSKELKEKGILRINGETPKIAQGGQNSDWGIRQLEHKAKNNPKHMEGVQNAVVLFGSNDIGIGGKHWTVEQIFKNLKTIYRLLKEAGVERIYAVTVPPYGIYNGYKNRPAVNKRRIELNRKIRGLRGTGLVHQVMDSCKAESEGGLASEDAIGNPDGGSSFGPNSNGDHLHPKPAALAAFYQRELEYGTGLAEQNKK